MNIPLMPVKYTVAFGNLIHLIIWSLLEIWIMAALLISITITTNMNQWVFAQCSPVVFYIMLIKFFGFYGAYHQNYWFVVIHILLSTGYVLSIALSMIHLTVFAEDTFIKPVLWQQILAVVYHLSNFILLILSVVLFFMLYTLRTTTTHTKSSKTEESSGSASDPAEKKEEPKVDSKVSSKVGDNKLFSKLVPKKDSDQIPK